MLVSVVLGCAVSEPGAGGLNTVNCSSVHVRVFFLDPGFVTITRDLGGVISNLGTLRNGEFIGTRGLRI